MTIGIEIGNTGVRAVEVSSRGKTPTISKVAEVPLVHGIVADGDIKDPDALIEAIQELWDKGKFSTKTVSIGMSGKSAIIRQLDLPYEDPETFRESLPLRVADELPVNPDELTLDFHPLETFMDGDVRMQRCLVVGSYNVLLENVADVLSQAGLRVSKADFAPFGLIRLAHRLDGSPAIPASVQEGPWDVDVIVDMGSYTTTIAIHYNSRPLYVRTVDGGTEAITKALSEQLQVTLDEAEVIKRTAFTEPDSMEAKTRKITEYIVDALVSGLVQVVRESVDFYRGASESMSGIATVSITGGGTLIHGYAERLASELAAPVRQLDPIESFGSSKVKKSLTTGGRRYASAVGIALGGK